MAAEPNQDEPGPDDSASSAGPASNEYEEADRPEFDPPAKPDNPAVWRPEKRAPSPLAKHTADTRRFLAWAIVGSTLVLYGYLTVAMVFGWTGQDGYAGAIQTLAPLQSLAAATVGFFFGRQRGDK